MDPIQAVSDHLSERVKLEAPDSLDQSDNLDLFLKRKIKKDCASSDDLLNMNNSNLMYRGMFFMNDEARHFLAPALPIAPESKYFRDGTGNTQQQQPQQPQQQPQQQQDPMSNQSAAEVAHLNSNISDANHSSNHVQQPQQTITAVAKPTLKARPHSCGECGKTFLMKHHLTTHLRTHTGERPHSCPECGKTFALKHCLSTHLLLHTSDRPYKCAECNKSFTLKHHLVCISYFKYLASNHHLQA